MYRLRGLLNDAVVSCGLHHTLRECREVSEAVYQFMNESEGIIHMTFIAERNNQRAGTWIY